MGNRNPAGITPTTIVKEIRDILGSVYEADYVTVPIEPEDPAEELTPEQREKFIGELEESMRDAAKRFEFEKAAHLRDRIKVLKSLGIHEESQVAGPDRSG